MKRIWEDKGNGNEHGECNVEDIEEEFMNQNKSLIHGLLWQKEYMMWDK